MNPKISSRATVDPSKLVDSRLLVCASSGGGKSYLLRVLAERLSSTVQVIVLDPEGEFASLREKIDAVLVGPDGEVEAHPKSAALLARKLAELRTHAVIDIFELSLKDRRRYVRLFLESLLAVPKKLWHPIIVILDEAQDFAPQKGQAESLDAVVALMAQGRKRGFGGVLATQRLSRLSNDCAAEARNLLIGMTNFDADLKRAVDLLGMSKADWPTLRRLDPGEFFASGPALSVQGVERIRVVKCQTTHPKSGQRHMDPPKPSAKIRRVLHEFEGLPEQAQEEARSLDVARNQIHVLQREVRKLNRAAPAQQPTPPDKDAIRRAVAQGEARGHASLAKRLTVPLRKIQGLARKPVGDLVGEIDEVVILLQEATEGAPKAAPVPETPTPRKVSAGPSARIRATEQGYNGKLSLPHQRILDALAWLEAVGLSQPSRIQVAFAAGASPLSSGYQNNLGAMRTSGLLDYPVPGALSFTAEGRALAFQPNSPLTSEALQEAVYQKLSGPQGRILRPLCERHPEELGRAELAELSGYSPGSSGYQNNLGSMRTLGVLDYPRRGYVRAADIMFLE